ncbi:hypothetical protein, partial [Streptococcus pneumoniae]|uniref:hypothetical protein n=1 Tax=Streptococcus pneumoniae TaxID=1313 RepID=UPI001D0BF4CD
EKRNHPGSKLRQGFWMVFRFGVNNWGLECFLKADEYKIELLIKKLHTLDVYRAMGLYLI